MPFDTLPGRLAPIAPTRYIEPPPIIKPPKGPMIAGAIEGLSKILENWTPEARQKKEIEKLKGYVAQKQAMNILSGVDDPTKLKKVQLETAKVNLENAKTRGQIMKQKAQGGPMDPENYIRQKHSELDALPPGEIREVNEAAPLPEPDLPPLTEAQPPI